MCFVVQGLVFIRQNFHSRDELACTWFDVREQQDFLEFKMKGVSVKHCSEMVGLRLSRHHACDLMQQVPGPIIFLAASGHSRGFKFHSGRDSDCKIARESHNGKILLLVVILKSHIGSP